MYLSGATLDLGNVTAFVAVAEQLSFTKAAVRLNLSQPTITAQVKRLEDELGVMLLDRPPRSIKLTPAGEVFFSYAQNILSQTEMAIRAARKAAVDDVHRLRMSCPLSALKELVPSIVSEFRQTHPNVLFDLFAAHTSTTISGLQDSSIDIGYVRLPIQVRGLEVVRVHSEPFVVCLPPQHPLAWKDSIKLADLRDEQFILYGKRRAPRFHDHLLQLCEQAGFTPQVISEIDEMYVAPTVVAAGLGITIVPRMVISANTANITVRELGDRAVFSEIGVAARSSNRSPFVKRIFSISQSIGRKYSFGLDS